MAQHFLQPAAARSLSIAKVLRMTDKDAEQVFAALRWPETDGRPVCVHCGRPTCYERRRPNGSLRFRCKACRKDFSLTSGTLFAFYKLPLQTYLAAVAIFCNEVKGKSALALSRDLGVQYKTAWVLAHKIREAVSTAMKGAQLGGTGTEVDGGYFGGYVKPVSTRTECSANLPVLPDVLQPHSLHPSRPRPPARRGRPVLPRHPARAGRDGHRPRPHRPPPGHHAAQR